MPPLNNRIHACIQRVMLSFDDFSIKRRYKEKTVRIIKISLENGAICAEGNRTQDAPRRSACQSNSRHAVCGVSAVTPQEPCGGFGENLEIKENRRKLQMAGIDWEDILDAEGDHLQDAYDETVEAEERFRNQDYDEAAESGARHGSRGGSRKGSYRLAAAP